MPQHTVFQLLASRAQQIKHLEKTEDVHRNVDVLDRCYDEIDRILKTFMPSGSGFDGGTTFDLDKSSELKLVFYTAYHHMNDVGMYDGWTNHTITVIPTFSTPNLKVSGRNKRDIKDYIAETFYNHGSVLVEEVWNPVVKEFTFYGPYLAA